MTQAAPPPIPDYELMRLIGRGAYGDVWLARGVTGVLRAVKIVWRDRFPDATPYEREFRGLRKFTAIPPGESRQLALLHAGRGTGGDFFFYVMELADDAETGRDIDPARYVPLTLGELRVRRGRLPAADCIALGVELARAVAGLHARGLVHRDIKPSNVVLVGGVPKLADIGLVAAAGDATTFVGTEGFVPPEGPGAPTADVFGLGRLLYELLTGFDRQAYPQLPADLHTWPDRKAALELNEVIIRACEPRLAQRHADAAALLDELLLLQAGRSVRRLRAAEHRVTRALRVATLLALVAGVAGLGAFLERTRAEEETARRRTAEAERDALARRTVYAATLAQALHALEQEDHGRARRLLGQAGPKPGEPDLRDFEWHALMDEAQGDPAVILRETGPASDRVRFSPDGRLIAVHDETKTVTLYDATGHAEVRRIAGVHRLAGFSADGRWLVGTNPSLALQRWSVTDGLPDPARSPGTNRPLAPLGSSAVLTFTEAIPGEPHRLRAWDFPERRNLWTLDVPHTGGIERGDYYAAAVSSDGTRCALALLHGRAQQAGWRLMVLTLPSGAIVWEETSTHRPTALCFGDDAGTLACAWGDSSELSLLDLEARAWRWRTPLATSQPTALALVAPGVFGAGGQDLALRLIDARTGGLVGTRHGHNHDLQDVQGSPASGMIAATGNGGDVRIWSLHPSPETRLLSGFWAPAGGGRALCVSADAHWVAATLDLQHTRLIDARSGTRLADIPAVLAPVAFSPDNRALWLLGRDGSLQRWSVAPEPGLTATIPLPASADPLLAGAASADARCIATLDVGGRLAVVDTDARQVTAGAQTNHGTAWWVCVSPDGRYACTGGNNRTVCLWTLPEARRLTEWTSDSAATNGAFSPDSRLLVLTLSNGSFEVRPVATPLAALTGSTGSGRVLAIAFHPSGRRLFIGGQKEALHVIDTTDWSELIRFDASRDRPPTGALQRAALSQDGTLLVGYTEAGFLRLWRAGPASSH